MFTARSLTRAQWALRIVLALQCTGLAAKLLWGEFESESDLYGWLYFDLGWPEELALQVEEIGTWTYFACGLTLLIVPLAFAIPRVLLQHTRRRTSSDTYGEITWLQIVCLLQIALWQGALSVLHAYRGGSFMAEWTVAAHATRIFTPLALIALLLAKPESNSETARASVGDWILRLATAATFITHGVEAIRWNPAFIDLLIGSATNLLGLTLAQSTAVILLYIIGIVDIVLAMVLMGRRWRLVAGYLAFWGFVTACSRITAAGLVGFTFAYPETLIRAANGGAPLAVCILCYAAASRNSSPNDANSNSTFEHRSDET